MIYKQTLVGCDRTGVEKVHHRDLSTVHRMV